MRNAIQTKELEGVPLKVKATYGFVSETYNYDPAKSEDVNHVEAAAQLATQQHLFGAWHGGQLSSGKYAFVRIAVDGVPAFSVPYPED